MANQRMIVTIALDPLSLSLSLSALRVKTNKFF